jgi:CelD/BcsL family acetyltransferase involved in cellulose biosynthesis
VDSAGEPQAGLPFCSIEDMKDRRIASLPFSDYCDPLVGDIEQWNCLIEGLLAEQCLVSIRCLRNQIPLTDKRFDCYYQAKWHGLDLQPDLDSLWNNLESSARRAIRKAQSSGVTVRIAQSREDLRAFFTMHLRLRKYKYRLLAQPYCFLEHIWEQFVEAQNGLILLAAFQDRIIGGTFFLIWKNCLYYKFNASLTEQSTVRPNDSIIWEGIKYAKSHNLNYLDFGLSDWDEEGLIRYKRKFASDEKAISFLRYVPKGVPSERERQIRSLLPQLTDLFTETSVPDSITERAGELLYRFFV